MANATTPGLKFNGLNATFANDLEVTGNLDVNGTGTSYFAGKIGIAQTSPQGDIHIGNNDGSRKIILHGANSSTNSSEIIFGDASAGGNISAPTYAGMGIRFDSNNNNLSIRSFWNNSTTVDDGIVTFDRFTHKATFAGRVIIGDDAITTDKPGLVVGDTTNNGQITIRGQQPTLFFDKTGANNAVILTDAVSLKFKNGTIDSEGSDQLTLDTSGNATFEGNVRINGNNLEFSGAAAKISGTSGGQISLNYNTGSNQALVWYAGGTTPKFSVTNNGEATFEGDVTVKQDLIVGNAAGSSTTAAFGTFDQLRFDNSFSDANRGPNKIVMHDNASTWIGGFGIHTDTVAYYTGGTHKFYKTTSQSASNELLRLESTGATFAGNAVVVDPASGDAELRLQSSTQTLRLDQNSIRTTTNSDLNLFTNGNGNQLFLDQGTGNVGVNTSSPQYRLDVNQGAPSTSGVVIPFRVSGGTMSSSGDGTAILLTNRYDAVTGGDYGAYMRIVSTQGSPNFLNPRLEFGVQNNNTNAISDIGTKMTILGSGNVGIATTSPASKLQFSSNNHATDPGGKDYSGSAINADGGDISTGRVFFQGYQNGATDLSGINNETNRVVLYNYTDGRYLQIWDHAGSSSIPNGNFGIGTDSPSSKLHVVGNSILANNTAIDPDSVANTVVAGAVADGSGWGLTTAIGGNAGTGHSWGLGSNGAAFYMGYQNGSADNTLQSFLIAYTNRHLQLVPTSGNVFIGNATATSRLRVKSTGNTEEQITVESGGNTNTLVAIGQSDNGNSSGAIELNNTNGAVGVHIDGHGPSYFNRGKVGIGTTSPDTILHIESASATGAILNLETTHTGGIPIYNMKGAHSAQLRYQDENGNNQSRIDFNDGGDFNFIKATDGTSYLKITSAGNVGIGTISPTYRLDINSSDSGLRIVGTTRSQILLSNSTSAWQIESPTSSGNVPAGAFGIIESGVGSRFTILTGGNVGIGTTDPDDPLHILGSANGNVNIRIENSNTGTNAYASLRFENNSIDTGVLFLNSSNNTQYGGANSLNLYQGGNHTIGFNTNNLLRMAIKGNGNVGIGTNSPAQNLHVAGTARFTGSSYGIEISNPGGGPIITFGSSSDLDSFGSIGQQASQYRFTTQSRDFNFLNGSSSRMMIKASGEVGINTTSPAQKLHVEGALRVSSGADRKIDFLRTGGNHFSIEHDTTQIYFYNHTTSESPILMKNNGDVLMNSGNVGINITSPGQKLTVNSDSSGTSDVVRINHGNGSHTGHGLSIRSANSGDALHVDGTAGSGFAKITSAYNANPTFSISGDIVAFASSDKRFKDNLKIIEKPINKLQQLNGYTFDWNNKQDVYKGKDYGVVAQEVEKVAPELVNTRFDGYKAVKYEKLVPLLIESVKELKLEIEELKKQIKQ